MFRPILFLKTVLTLLSFTFYTNAAAAQDSYIHKDELDVALFSADWAVLKNLRSEGDLRHKKRPVDHFLYPKRVRRAQLDEFIAVIKKHKGVTNIKILPKKGIHVIYNSDTRAQSIARMIVFLNTQAPSFGYNYDGWATYVIRK